MSHRPVVFYQGRARCQMLEEISRGETTDQGVVMEDGLTCVSQTSEPW